MKSEKHLRGMLGRGQQPPITSLASVTSTSAIPVSLAIPTTTPPQLPEQTRPPETTQDLSVMMGGNATLRAETLWCLNTASKHQSELFGAIFPDSNVAKAFTCGKDKTGYIIWFGLRVFFKKELTKNISQAGPFVIIFDESLNQSNKKKQLDIHVRYWEDGEVWSRYYGSQFLGHGKAEDLLDQVKVSQLSCFVLFWFIYLFYCVCGNLRKFIGIN